MVGYKLGATPSGVALGGLSNLINRNPHWKREFDNLVNKALVESESRVSGDAASEQLGRFVSGQFCLIDDDIA